MPVPTLRRFLVGVLLAGLALAGLAFGLAHHDVKAAAEERFGAAHGPVALRLEEAHLSSRHGLWIVFRLGFARSPETATQDLGLWYLLPLRTVAFTKDWWSDAFRQ